MESPLFKLPGELRNRIYSYVLSRDDPRHPAAVFATQHSSKARHHEKSDTAFVRQTRQGHNVVTRFRAGDLEIANQLQFVNKQLRAETAGLTHKYNKDQIAIHQTSQHQDGAAQQLWSWMSSVGVDQLGQLGPITITLSGMQHYSYLGRVPMSDPPLTMYDLYSLLNACLNITVKYVVIYWRIPFPHMPLTRGSFAHWMEFGRSLRSMFVQTIPYIPPTGREPDGSPSAPDLSWSVAKWTRSHGEAIDKPANLIILPNQSGEEREEMLAWIRNHSCDHEIEGTSTKDLATS